MWIITLIIGLVGGGGLTAIIVKMMSRKLETVQAERIRVKMETELSDYWKQLSIDLEKRVECLEKRLKEELVANMQLKIENNNLKLEQARLTARVVELESKIQKGTVG